MDQVLNGDDTIFAKALLNELVIGQWDALAVDLSVSALVHEFTNALEVRLTIGDPRLNNAKHLEGSLGEANEDTVVDLEETKELENLAGFGGNLVDTFLLH